jgi:acyl-activating enzyme 14
MLVNALLRQPAFESPTNAESTAAADLLLVLSASSLPVFDCCAGPPTTQPLESVSTILLGGGGTPPAVQDGMRVLFPRAAVHTAYGMTEACSSMTFLPLWGPSAATGPAASLAPAALPAAAAGSALGGQPPAGGVFVGAAPPGLELALYHAPQSVGATGSPTEAAPSLKGSAGTAWGRVAAEGEGEIVTRGPHVMLGYWEDEAATQAAFLPGGWMRTGDLGCMRQGG